MSTSPMRVETAGHKVFILDTYTVAEVHGADGESALSVALRFAHSQELLAALEELCTAVEAVASPLVTQRARKAIDQATGRIA